MIKLFTGSRSTIRLLCLLMVLALLPIPLLSAKALTFTDGNIYSGARYSPASFSDGQTVMLTNIDVNKDLVIYLNVRLEDSNDNVGISLYDDADLSGSLLYTIGLGHNFVTSANNGSSVSAIDHIGSKTALIGTSSFYTAAKDVIIWYDSNYNAINVYVNDELLGSWTPGWGTALNTARSLRLYAGSGARGATFAYAYAAHPLAAMIGDSITAGSGVGHNPDPVLFTGVDKWQYSMPKLLGDYLKAGGIRNYFVANKGKVSDTTQMIKDRFTSDILQETGCGYVFIQGGINDFYTGSVTASIANKKGTAALAAAGGVTPFIIGVMPTKTSNASRQAFSVNLHNAETAGYSGYNYINVWDAMEGTAENIAADGLMADEVHPNEAGAAAVVNRTINYFSLSASSETLDTRLTQASADAIVSKSISYLSPGTSTDTIADGTHGMVTGDKVLFRKDPNSSDFWDHLNTGWVAKVLSTSISGGYTWYRVETNIPVSMDRTYVGYIRGDFFRMLSQQEETAWLISKPQPFTGTAPGQPPIPSSPSELAGFIKINKPGTNLRSSPGGESMLQMPIATILPFYGSVVSSMGYNWAYVNHPSAGFGYVRGDCFDFSTQAGVIVTPPPVPVQPPVQPTAAPGGTTGYIKLIKGGVNLRQTAGGPSIAQLDRDTVLPYYGFTQQGGYTWYYVLSTLGSGYIRSDMAMLTDGSGQIPITTPPPGNTEASGYILTLLGGINLRRTPNLYAEVLLQVAKGRVLPLAAPVVTNAGYNWYFVQVDGRTGYLRGDTLRQLTAQEVTLYLSNGVIPGAVAPAPDPSQVTGHIVTTISSVNVRVSPSLDARVLTQTAAAGAVFPMYTTVMSGGRSWYKIQSGGQTAYLMGSLARVMTAAEYQAWLATQAPTATPQPNVTPNPADLSSTAVTNIDRVIVRAAASMTSGNLTLLYKAGSVAKLLGASTAGGGYSWYPVTAGGITGYIRADLLRVLTKTEEAALNQTGDPSAPPEASYRTLVTGMSGDDVTRLQTKLVQLTFLPSSAISGTYTTETENAVRAYQTAAGLFVDGVAGANTQHKLYNTVPVGTYSPTPGPATLYPVEYYTWQPNSNNTAFWPLFTNANQITAVLTDVKTGISWTTRRWSGGQHADIEPLDAEATAAMCRVYGVTSAQQILEKNLYQRRPVWVTVLGHTYAGSIYGVPHNYPDGDHTPTNNFNGQFCVHFINSRTHSSGVIDAAHQAAIKYAYDNAPSRMP